MYVRGMEDGSRRKFGDTDLLRQVTYDGGDIVIVEVWHRRARYGCIKVHRYIERQIEIDPLQKIDKCIQVPAKSMDIEAVQSMMIAYKTNGPRYRYESIKRVSSLKLNHINRSLSSRRHYKELYIQTSHTLG